MELSFLDIVVFLAFFGIVIGVSMYKSRKKEETGEDFFLAGRGLFWPLIGLSLIAANISTEHFVGMAGQGAGIAGMAIASYEWIAAITLVFVAVFFLPKFLRSGIFTIPEYLEYRYDTSARVIIILLILMTAIKPLKEPVVMPVRERFDMKPTPAVLWLGAVVIAVTLALYVIFW